MEDTTRIDLAFLAGMAHELRTPLAAIGGYAELLEHGMHGPMNDGQTDMLRRIKRNQRTLIAMINEVLEFAEVALSTDASAPLDEHGSALAAAGTASPGVALRSVAAEAVAALLSAADSAKPLTAANVENDVPAELPLVRGESRHLRHMLDALLQDAAHGSPAGAARVRLSAAPAASGAVVFTVESNGPAIAPGDADAAFAAFSRDGRPARGGQQLWLPTVAAVARRSGGSVRVAPGADGLPRRFVITLPIESGAVGRLP